MSPATAKTNKKVEFLTLKDALTPRPSIEYIVEKLVTRGSVCCFYGEGGSKKTYVIMTMGLRASKGDKFLNFNTKQCNVLFIDQESGKARILDRMEYVAQAY